MAKAPGEDWIVSDRIVVRTRHDHSHATVLIQRKGVGLGKMVIDRTTNGFDRLLSYSLNRPGFPEVFFCDIHVCAG